MKEQANQRNRRVVRKKGLLEGKRRLKALTGWKRRFVDTSSKLHKF